MDSSGSFQGDAKSRRRAETPVAVPVAEKAEGGVSGGACANGDFSGWSGGFRHERKFLPAPLLPAWRKKSRRRQFVSRSRSSSFRPRGTVRVS